ncbi:hypothetical protein [Candidatus Absconditicoccus praedator]|uniref:hypothetical protein n=1 Tax=Candidatus Absconditicoccus praedator TaxID=2735562 RepID=UPI001E43990F|nr:hypothetical protein [Candidatus Absconditicoccus praedator]UFX83501.1 hypothetical protein HLG78_05220 [Candidatus Absconditicoccus praedator]
MNLKNLMALMLFALLSLLSFSTVYGDLIGSDILGKKGGKSESEFSDDIGTVFLGEAINIRTVVVFTGDEKKIEITSPTGAPIGSSDIEKKQGCEQVNINKGRHTNFTLSTKDEDSNKPCEFELILDYENTQVGNNNFRLFLDNESRQSVSYQGTKDISISSAKTKDFDGEGEVTHIRAIFSTGFDLDKVDKNKYTIRLGDKDKSIESLSGANGEGDFVDFELDNPLTGDARPSIQQASYDDGGVNFEQTSFLRTSDRVAPILNTNLDDGSDTELENSIDVEVSLTEEGKIYYGYGLENEAALIDEGNVLEYDDAEKSIKVEDEKTLYIIGKDFADNQTKLWSHTFTKKEEDEEDDDAPRRGGGGGGGGAPAPSDDEDEDEEDVDEEDVDEEGEIDDDEELEEDDDIDEDYEKIKTDDKGRVVERGETTQSVRESLVEKAPENLQPAMNQVSNIFEIEVEYIENRSLVSDNLFGIKEGVFDSFRKTFEKVLEYREQRNPELAQQALDYYEDYQQQKQEANQLISSYIKEVDISEIDKTVYQARDENLNQAISLVQDMIFDKNIELYNNNQITEDELDEYVQVYNEFIWSVIVFNIERNEISRNHARSMIQDFVYYYQM